MNVWAYGWKAGEMATPKSDKKTKLTLSCTPEDKKLLKQVALERDTTVSAMVHEWVEREFWGKKTRGK